MIEIDNLTFSFGRRMVLDNVSCTVPTSSVVGLVGPTGAGKSVLLKTIAGIFEPDRGEVRCKRESLSLMFQEGALFDSLTVFDNVAFPLVQGRVPITGLSDQIRNEVTEKVAWILTRVGLDHAAQKMPGQLSGGMRRRASLARALVSRPEILLLDDPTSGLDPVASSVIMDLIVQLHAEYHPTVVIVSHDLRRLLPIIESVVCLFAGEVAYNGLVAGLSQESPQYVQEFISCRYNLKQEFTGDPAT